MLFKKSRVEELLAEVRRLRELYARELKKRDKQIDELEKKNELLFKTAIKQSKTADEWRSNCMKLAKEVEILRKKLEEKKE